MNDKNKQQANLIKLNNYFRFLWFKILTFTIKTYTGGPNISGPILPNLSEIFCQKNSRYLGPKYKKGAQYCRICKYVRNFWAKNFRQYCPPPCISFQFKNCFFFNVSVYWIFQAAVYGSIFLYFKNEISRDPGIDIGKHTTRDRQW
jgi:hypothetical protein